MKKFLPLGSVVKIQGYEKRLMIYGRAQRNAEHPGRVFDYIACEYPVGTKDTNEGILFDHELISEIYFIGFQDVEEIQFRIALSKYLEANLGDSK